ncbi:MAG: PASTA domain-containing protein [Lachnospiraceae bacterium]|nr:PASTA domain-containing protein [Lachnospiraceae bacterium]
MNRSKTYQRKKIVFFCMASVLLMLGLIVRSGYLMVYQSEYYTEMASQLHQRERYIKAARGNIYDASGTLVAANRTVCTISVIHNQIQDEEKVVSTLAQMLDLEEAEVQKKVEKYSAREIIKTNVDKEIGDQIRLCQLAGVKVDEDYKRYYPYGSLASKVLGFTGSDNQGIIGLEVKYEEYLKGTDGLILTLTDARGVEIDQAAEERIEPVAGNDLHISLDVNIQKYAEQAAYKIMEEKGANSVSVIIMNPQNGEIYAMVNVPEFDLNEPFTLLEEPEEPVTAEEKQNLLNQMWRNGCINDTYEPGSTFKIITMTAGLESGVVSPSDSFYCPGYKVVEDRRIRCHKVAGHGAEDFVLGAMNSCNPVFIEVGLRLGVNRTYEYLERLGLLEKTGVDLPGEAGTIMHKKENVGEVELATVSFGQSFQITPLRLLTSVCSVINGGTQVTPHFGVSIHNADGEQVYTLEYPVKEGIISEETSSQVREILEKVVAEGTGKRAYLPGFRIGGKTATSEKLPRRSGKYISSFLGFAPADNPQVAALITIDEPEGIYYGGTVAAPVIASIFDNILPYLGVEPSYTEAELSAYEIGEAQVPDFMGMTVGEAKEVLQGTDFDVRYIGLAEGEGQSGKDAVVTDQFPLAGEQVQKTGVIILYFQ